MMNKRIKITSKLMKYLNANHGGQNCPKYWVLSRATVLIKKKVWEIDISDWEEDSIPNDCLIYVFG